MINPVPENVEKILNSPAHLIVPKYQRDYKWGTSEAGEFWEDLESYVDTNDDHLFLGNLIFDISEIGQKRIGIIDGQQRITTILILLIACRQLAKRINAVKIANKIQEKICFEDSTTGEFLGSRLFASESVKMVFDHLCKDEWDEVFPDKLFGKQVKRQSNRIKPIYNYFLQKISTFDQPKLSKLLTTLYNSYIVRIDIEDEIEAFKIFERTNARGIELEASDLLKNYLFSNLGNSAEESWYRITDLSGGTLLKMLKYFYVSKKGKVTKSELYKKLKTYGKELTPQVLLSDLEHFAEFYNAFRTADSANMMNYFTSIGLNCLLEDQEKFEEVYFSVEALRLFKITQMYPLILSAIGCYLRSGYGNQRSYNSRLVKFFKQIENYHFINNAICERIGNEIEALYADYSKKFAESTNFDETSNALNSDLKSQIATQEEFVSRFVDISYQPSTIPLIAYIFHKINNYSLATGQHVRIFNPDERILRRNHNIEHFYPQNPLLESELPKLNDEDINNIGNLICISFRTNSKLGNLSPAEKAARLTTDLETEVTNIPYVRTFLEEYKDVLPSWDKNAIASRATKIAQDAYIRVWKFN
jgi:hypothetical protein